MRLVGGRRGCRSRPGAQAGDRPTARAPGVEILTRPQGRRRGAAPMSGKRTRRRRKGAGAEARPRRASHRHLHPLGPDAAPALRLDRARRHRAADVARPARKSRRSRCRWSTSWSRPTACAPTTWSNSSPSRSRASSRASTASSTSTPIPTTTARHGRRARFQVGHQVRRGDPACPREAARQLFADPARHSRTAGGSVAGINDVAIVTLTLSPKARGGRPLVRQCALQALRRSC